MEGPVWVWCTSAQVFVIRCTLSAGVTRNSPMYLPIVLSVQIPILACIWKPIQPIRVVLCEFSASSGISVNWFYGIFAQWGHLFASKWLLDVERENNCIVWTISPFLRRLHVLNQSIDSVRIDPGRLVFVFLCCLPVKSQMNFKTSLLAFTAKPSIVFLGL